jgi:predicted enzyme related to lactoylglutathione lyase
MGDKGEEIYGFEIGGGNGFYIGDHSKVKGKNREPERVIFNLEVDDIEKEAKKLEEAGVKQIRDIYHVEGYGLISTFEDLDGNYFQLVQVRPS